MRRSSFPTAASAVVVLALLAVSCGGDDATGPGTTFDPLVLLATSLATGVTGTAYKGTLAASGGDGSYAWTVTVGSLPGGLALSAGGVISGTPTGTGASTFTVQVSSGDGQMATRQFTLDIYAPLAITTLSLPDATEDLPYSQGLAATGGQAGYTWSVASGSLPVGLTLGTTTGTISGTTAAVGGHAFTAQVASGDGQTAQAPLSLTVAAAPPGVMLTPILFNSDRDGDAEIFVMDPDGQNQTPITSNLANDFNASWSPDGSRVVFRTDRDGNDEVYIMDADGQNQANLSNHAGGDFTPAISPDGTKVAFMSNRDGNSEIYVMDIDGQNQVNLTNNGAADAGPRWSPDGTKIVFHSSRDGNVEVYVMDADGQNPANLSNHASDDYSPSFSPDGSKIAWTTNRDGNFNIYIMDAGGSNPTPLTTHAGNDFTPTWSPDGSTLAFSSQRDGNPEIYIIGADGSGLLRLTSNTDGDYEPHWKPVP